MLVLLMSIPKRAREALRPPPGAIAVMHNDADGNDVRLGYLFKGKLYDALHEALDNGGKFYASINSVDWDRRENDPKKCIEFR